jgi:multiphosphoryl transfer protein
MQSYEIAFECPLPLGLHARPASLVSETAARFAATTILIKEPDGSSADAKSVLALIALEVRLGDRCVLRIVGEDAAAAHAALRALVLETLPQADAPLPPPPAAMQVPRALRIPGVTWRAGTPASPGIGQGIVVLLGGPVLPAHIPGPAVSRSEAERRARGALAAVRAALAARLQARPDALEAGILAAQLAMARDTALESRILARVESGSSAAQAVADTGTYFATRFRAAESALVRERAVDIEDVCAQMLEAIQGSPLAAAAPAALPAAAIVVAGTLAPRQLLALDRRHLCGLVLEHAGTTSHAVILARSFGIPTLTGVADARACVRAGGEAIVDADAGLLICNLVPEARRHYDRRRWALARRHERLAQSAQRPAVTRDGRPLEVAASVSTREEIGVAFAHGADGIGLFRTEMLFMDRDSPPSEDEQAAIYAEAARLAAGRTVIIRTLDVGGDKPLSYLGLPPEKNPFLGMRGVRLYPAHRDLVAAQLRAILRASSAGRVWMLLPMVSHLEEVRWVKEQIAAAQRELQAAGVAFAAEMPLGVMLEVPAAALLVDQLSDEVGFFSIGTNDLAQYLFAADRGDDRLAGVSDVRHPAFLRLLVRVVQDAHARGRWVGLCGEMARSRRDLPLLLGLGLDEISAAAPEIPAIKAAVAGHSAAACAALLAQATACKSAAEVEALQAAFHPAGPARALVDPELVVLESDSATKEEVIAEIANGFFAAERCDDPQAVEEAVWAREAVYATGLGHGFAVPHCRTDAVTADSIGVVRLAQPIPWQSLDEEPVRCVILLAIRASDAEEVHLRILALLARRLMHAEFREHMLGAPDREAVLQCLHAELGMVDAPS